MATTTNLTGQRLVLPAGLDRDNLIRAFRLMYTSRRIDDREILLKRQNRIFFQISGAGHEAVQVATGMILRPRHDWFYPYYRDRALALTLGVTAEEMLLGSVGAAEDPASGGRQMPSHWSSPELHIVTGSSPTGTQFVQSVGCANGSRYLNPESDELTLVCTGEGATSEGEFWESLNVACLDQLSMLFLVEDNGWAISVPVERQTAGGNIARLVAGFPGLLVLETDGTDFIQSYNTLRDAVDYIRRERKPALVRASVTRPYSHSLSDDERLYKSKSERDAEAARDPIVRYPEWLVSEGLLDRHALQLIVHEVDGEIQRATDHVLKASPPPKGSALIHLYSDKCDPASVEFESEPRFEGDPRTMIDEINLTLHEEMRRNDKVLVFGEDVADCSREENLREVKGKGGVFKATAGLQTKYGSSRVFNTPIAEASIVGRAIGMATRGLKPVAEIQFFDYIWPAMMQIRDELCVMRWRSNGNFKAPVVLRVAIGGYLTGGAVYHSQSGESIFTHCPGLRVVMPSTALDVAGLLRTAISCDDPVMFLEHKHLYRQPYNRSEYPGSDFTIPFGKARMVKEGEDVSIITYGAFVHRAEVAAAQLEREGISTEIIDLRSLSPYDWEAIAATVRKTHRVIVAYEDMMSWGYGAEIAARIAEELFDELDAPVKRIAATDTFCAYQPKLEDVILPQSDAVVATVKKLVEY